MTKTKTTAILMGLLALTPLGSSARADPDPEVPSGSGDYRKMLALGVRYKKGQITFAELQRAIVDAKLPPHSLGDGYLKMVPPPPPPGMKFEPDNMPRDWEKTFGEVYMVAVRGQITDAEYDKLHAAAHGKLAGFPNCKKK